MTRPVIATKLYVPRLRRSLVARPRLTERLRNGDQAKLTLVSAPAGFGKTTLIAEWLRSTPRGSRPVAWLSLDAADSDPASFWTYVMTALQAAAPESAAHALEVIASSQMPIEVVLTSVLNELTANLNDVWLVLDDYHLVAGDDVGDGVAFLLEHLPPNVHVVISTRADPDLPLSRWRGRGELVEIRAAELRFTYDEANAYLTEVTALPLTAEDVSALEERTEGWIAALQLTALSMQGRNDIAGFISRFAGNDRYVVDYLVEEVLQHQTDSVRRFLLQSSVLGRLTGPLCDALTGRDDGNQMLTALERANLFIVALDDQREWYRYHHLFADVLRSRILSEQPEQVPLLHQRASRWYEGRNLVEDAISHALAACDFDRAAHLMETAASTNRRNRQDATLFGWLKALPDDVVRHSPLLNLFYGWMLMLSGDLDTAESRYDDAERALAAVLDGTAPSRADNEKLQALPATIAVYRASLAQARGDVEGTSEHARRALSLVGPNDHLARGGAAGLLALTAWASGDVSSAMPTFTQAVASLHAAGNLADELSGAVVLADMWLAAGRPGEARRVYADALQRATNHGDTMPRATADLHVGLSELDYEVGDLESARRHLDLAAALEERASMTENRYRRFVSMARISAAEGDVQRAITLLGQAEQLYVKGFFPYVRPIAAIRARLWIAQGKLPMAAAWAGEQGLSADDEVRYLREFDHLTLVRLLIARHRAHPQTQRLDQALGLLARLAEAAETSGRAGSLMEIRMLHALALDAQERRPQALEALSQALTEAPEPDGYARLFLDEGNPMVALLADAEHGAASDHARRLISLGSSSQAQPLDPVQRATRPSAALLSARELQVLRLLDSELSAPEIARQLFVSYNTVRSHTTHIFSKLDVTSRQAALRRARELGLM